jgi:LmbE family N-acetylglucosaminyl deacetylase
MILSRLFSVIFLMLISVQAMALPLPIEGLLSGDPRIIIFSPHPDDDVLSSSGLMKAILALRAHGSLADIRVVYMTCGDGYDKALAVTKRKGTASTYAELGELRHREALAALNQVGVPASKAIFLGFPDGGMDKIFAMDDSSVQPYTSPHTEVSSVPYAFAFHPNEMYLKSSVLNDVKAIIEDFKPTIVFTPTLTDQHLDHRATREFVTEVLTTAGTATAGTAKDLTPPLHLEFLVHWEHTDLDWPKATVDWSTPTNHVPAEYSLAIGDYGYSINDKKRVIGFHQSQVDVDGDYLLNFAKVTEVFWTTKEKIEDYLTGPSGCMTVPVAH